MAVMHEAQFIGGNLRIARNFHGLTLAELGRIVSLSHSLLHQFEAELSRPTEPVVASLAQALQLEPSFFSLPIKEEFRDEECHFRGENMPRQVKTRVLAHGTLFGTFVRFMDQRVRLPKIELPVEDAAGKQAVERAAERCRVGFGLGLDRPITSMCRLLENKGVVVTRFGASTESSDAINVDAFSRMGTRPVVVLNTDKASTSRNRWDMAHELGHLILHGGMQPGDAELERDANSFASAFLLPRVGFLREFPLQQRLDWEIVFAIKRRWKVSAAAILKRGLELKRMDAGEYKRAWKHYLHHGWNKGEPDEPADEPPELVPKALQVLEESARTALLDVAKALGWTPAIFERVVGVPACSRPQVPEDESGKVIPFPRER